MAGFEGVVPNAALLRRVKLRFGRVCWAALERRGLQLQERIRGPMSGTKIVMLLLRVAMATHSGRVWVRAFPNPRAT